jgi:phage terminase large subunit-like protein
VRTRSSGRRLSGPDPTTAWAQAAVRGDFVVGELVRHAAERHLRDLKDARARGYFWRPELAQRVLDFFPSVFTITDGPAAGRPFTLIPYQTFCAGSLMGWVNADGRWRFRSAWIETGKGQAKSPLMAGLGLYAMGWCGFERSQVYSIAANKQTANVLFKDASAMCRAPVPGYEEHESLEALGHVVIRGEYDNAWKIEHPASGSFFLPLAGGEQQSGPRPRMVLADEIHEFTTDSQIETWRRAITKVAGSAMMVLGTNTPATSQIVGTSYSDTYQAIAKGELKDDSAFAFVARVDKADRETVFENEACWSKALPALGVTYPDREHPRGGPDREDADLDRVIGQAPLLRDPDRRGRLLDRRGELGRCARHDRRGPRDAAWLQMLAVAGSVDEERPYGPHGDLARRCRAALVEDLVLDDARGAS